MAVAASSLINAGHTVKVWQKEEDISLFCRGLALLVLPYPATRDGETVAGTSLAFSALPLGKSAALFGGRLPPAWRKGRKSFDAEENEAFLLDNAYLTAAAGVCLALRTSERAFFRMTAAVLGYGRIGKQTAKMLRALGADTTVYARREDVCRLARQDGFGAALLCEKTQLPEGLVLGTIPAPAPLLSTLSVKGDALIYDLGGGLPSSLPSACGAALPVLYLKGAPGVFAPRAAGEIYGGAILSFLDTLSHSSHPARKDQTL